MRKQQFTDEQEAQFKEYNKAILEAIKQTIIMLEATDMDATPVTIAGNIALTTSEMIKHMTEDE